MLSDSSAVRECPLSWLTTELSIIAVAILQDSSRLINLLGNNPFAEETEGSPLCFPGTAYFSDSLVRELLKREDLSPEASKRASDYLSLLQQAKERFLQLSARDVHQIIRLLSLAGGDSCTALARELEGFVRSGNKVPVSTVRLDFLRFLQWNLVLWKAQDRSAESVSFSLLHRDVQKFGEFLSFFDDAVCGESEHA